MSPRDFDDRPALALRYENEARTLLANRLRVCCWLAMTLVPLFIALDAVLHPQLLRVFMMIRVTMLACTALVLLALRTRVGARYAAPLSLCTFLQTGFGIVLMTSFNGGGSSPYYAGVNLVMLAGAVLMPWELSISVACCVTLVAAYALSCLAWAGVPDARVFVGNLFFLFSTAIITAASHHVGAEARRREFLQRVAIEEAGRHRDQFLANVTHELRTPLAAILGFCEMMADYMTEATDVQRGWLARIRENAFTLYRLIVQVLDFSKIEAGSMDLAHERVRLDTIVAKVADDMRAIAGPDGAEVTLELDVEAPVVIGDAGRIEEIVSNLGSNALKFSGGRPVVLRVATGAIDDKPGWDRIVPAPAPDTAARTYVQVAVIDRGEGIRREDLRRLFVAFQQLDGTPTRRHGGTGLGLAISARLAAAMHAHIAVRSTPGVGSTFALLAPVAQPIAAGSDTGGSHVGDAGAVADQPAFAVLVAER
ncbi:MAG: HAMP domain-containing histidine kinase [Deltaproteobacteria bacterium]|nr:HAMP domain-containing histidine kinase [Deltaproteobacteria bacterium]